MPSFPRTPFLASGALPPLRSGYISLDEAEHFLHNRNASVATLRWCSGSSRNAVRNHPGFSVRLRRNPHSSPSPAPPPPPPAPPWRGRGRVFKNLFFPTPPPRLRPPGAFFCVALGCGCQCRLTPFPLSLSNSKPPPSRGPPVGLLLILVCCHQKDARREPVDHPWVCQTDLPCSKRHTKC